MGERSPFCQQISFRMRDLVLSQDRTQELSLDGVFKDGNLYERRFLFQRHAGEFQTQRSNECLTPPRRKRRGISTGEFHQYFG